MLHTPYQLAVLSRVLRTLQNTSTLQTVRLDRHDITAATVHEKADRSRSELSTEPHLATSVAFGHGLIEPK